MEDMRGLSSSLYISFGNCLFNTQLFFIENILEAISRNPEEEISKCTFLWLCKELGIPITSTRDEVMLAVLNREVDYILKTDDFIELMSGLGAKDFVLNDNYKTNLTNNLPKLKEFLGGGKLKVICMNNFEANIAKSELGLTNIIMYDEYTSILEDKAVSGTGILTDDAELILNILSKWSLKDGNYVRITAPDYLKPKFDEIFSDVHVHPIAYIDIKIIKTKA